MKKVTYYVLYKMFFGLAYVLSVIRTDIGGWISNKLLELYNATVKLAFRFEYWGDD